MARILYSGIVSELKGSVKGTSFQRNAAGSIAHSKANSKFAPSALQNTRRSEFAVLVSEWNAISFDEKEAWNQLALAVTRTDFWGNVKTLSGIQWFMSINKACLISGMSLILSAPLNVNVLPVPYYNLDASASYLRMDFWSPIDINNRWIIVNATGPRRYTSSFSRQQFFYMSKATGSAIQYIDITTEWEAFFGIAWSDYYALANSGICCSPYAVNKSNGVSSAIQPSSWSK